MQEVILRASSAATFLQSPRYFVLGSFDRIKAFARTRVILHSQITFVTGRSSLFRLRGHWIRPWDEVVDCSGPDFPQDVREAFYEEIWIMSRYGGSSAAITYANV